jgi:cell division protein FtsB
VTREGAAGRGPGAKRPAPSRTRRTRAASPTGRKSPESATGKGRQTTLTARAAILVVAIASVMVAVALPLKIWLGQRGDIASLVAQTHQTQVHLDQLTAKDKKWQNPAYVESQARKRLHYSMPGVQTHILLGRRTDTARTSAVRSQTVTAGPWYSQFWASIETAGDPTTTGKATPAK